MTCVPRKHITGKHALRQNTRTSCGGLFVAQQFILSCQCSPGHRQLARCQHDSYQHMQVVLLVDQPLQRQQQWDEACTQHGTAFYSAAARGTCAYLFANLHLHIFQPLVGLADLHLLNSALPVYKAAPSHVSHFYAVDSLADLFAHPGLRTFHFACGAGLVALLQMAACTQSLYINTALPLA